MSDSRILQVTWAETSALTALDGTAATLQRFQAIVGRLVADAITAGELGCFSPPSRLPAIGEPGHDVAYAMQEVVDQAVASGQFAGSKLPPRAVLWEIGPDGAPRNAEPSLPAGCDWVSSPGARRSDFRASDGRFFRLYDTQGPAPAGSPSWVSGLTKSGLPTGGAATREWKVPLGLAVAAAILFFWIVASLGWSGRTIALAYDAMAVESAARAEFVNALPPACAADSACKNEKGSEFGSKPGQIDSALADCLALSPKSQELKTAADAAARAKQVQEARAMRESPFCGIAWREALTFANRSMGIGWEIAGPLLGWPIAGAGTGGKLLLDLAMAGLMISLALLGVAAGLAVKGRIFGVWISPQNRISLSRVQVSVWTIVVLGAYATLVAFNAGMISHAFQILSVEGIRGTGDLGVFPDIPGYVLATLGIAVTSTMASAVLKGDAAIPSLATSTAGGARPASQKGFYWRYLDRADNFPVRSSESGASFADLFTGETRDSADDVDVSRMQNVIVTFTLATGYLTTLLGMVHGVAGDTVALALHYSRSVFDSLPDPGGTFNILLLGSHAAYLASKASGGAPTADQS